MDQKSSIAHNASRMGLATLCSRVLGLAREQVFAYLFGASDAADAFNIAFRIPNLLRDLFAEGAMSSAFVPNFTKALVQSKKKAIELYFAVWMILVLGLSVLALIGIYLSPSLVALYASAFQSIPGKFELAIGLTQVMFPFFPMVALAALTMGALNALGYFFLPAFAPVLFNASSILTGLVLCPILAQYSSIPAIYGMGIGVLLGGFLQFSIQWWQIRRHGFVFSGVDKAVFKKPWKVDGVKKVLFLILPGTLGLAATQLNILVNSIYATSQGSGAVSWLNYSFRLMQFPIGIFGVSLAAATLPTVSRSLSLNDTKTAALDLAKSLKMTLSVNLPSAVGLVVIGLPLIQILFQHGAFEFSDAQQTYSALFWYALGLPAYSMIKVLVPIFYALNMTRIPVLISFFSVALNAALNHVFLRVFHYPFWILAFATSLTATLNAGVLMVWIAKKLPGVLNQDFFKSLSMHVGLSGIVFGVGYFGVSMGAYLQTYLGSVVQSEMVFWCLEVLFAVFGAISVWVGLGTFLKIDEIYKTTQFLQKKLCRRR